MLYNYIADDCEFFKNIYAKIGADRLPTYPGHQRHVATGKLPEIRGVCPGVRGEVEASGTPTQRELMEVSGERERERERERDRETERQRETESLCNKLL